MSETFPMDFTGAAKSEGEPGIICKSSDEEDMEILSTCSVADLYLSSEDETEEIRLMPKCIERQLTEPIAIPTTAACSSQKRSVTPRPNVPPFPTFGEKYFDLAFGNGPVSRDSRVKSNHPINLCRSLVPQIDTPLRGLNSIESLSIPTIHSAANHHPWQLQWRLLLAILTELL